MAEEKLTEKVRNMERRARKNRTTAEIVCIPLWEDQYRAAPNEVLRSALFNVGGRHMRRQSFEGRELAILGGGVLEQTGPELRQDDEDVWLQVMHWARESPLGSPIRFTSYAMLKTLGWPDKAENYRRLGKCLDRLQVTMIRLRCRRQKEEISVAVNLITKQKREGNRWQVSIEPEMHLLFGERFYTKVEWGQRLQLRGPTAKWLHGFYASHADPYPLKVESLMESCGSRTSELKKFRQQLRMALDDLVRVGFLERAQIEDDLVIVRRSK